MEEVRRWKTTRNVWKVFCSSNIQAVPVDYQKIVWRQNRRENKAVSERATDKQVHINLLYELQFAGNGSGKEAA